MIKIEDIINYIINIRFSDIVNFILHPNFTGWLLILKILFLIISLFFLGIIVFVLFRTRWLRLLILWDLKEFLTYRPYAMKKFIKNWNEIKKRLTSGLESEAKLGLIEAEAILDDILKRMGYPGESLGERLDKLTTDVLPNLEQVIEAHKIKNNVIHDPTYKFNSEQAKEVLAVYEKSFTDLDAL